MLWKKKNSDVLHPDNSVDNKSDISDSNNMDEVRIQNIMLVLAYALVLVLVSSIFFVYGVKILSVWNVLAALICAGVFVLCRLTAKKKIEGSLVLVLLLLTALFLFGRLAAGNDYGSGFGQWFFTGASQRETMTRYLAALLIGFTIFFGVNIYYFSQVQYRMVFLTLLSLIPCVLYVKVLSDINNVYLVIIVFLNAALHLLHAHQLQGHDYRRVGRRSMLTGCAVFLFALLLVAAVIPKKEEARYHEVFENIFMGGNTQITLSDDFTQMSDYSGNADFYDSDNFDNRRMYTMYAPVRAYMKRQTFDYYDFEKDRWYPDQDYSRPRYRVDEWQEEQLDFQLSNFQDILKKVESYEPGFAAKYGMDELISEDTIEDTVYKMTVQSNEFGAVYYIVPTRCVQMGGYDVQDDIYVTDHGVFRTTLMPHDSNISYTVRYYDEAEVRKKWFLMGGSDLDNETADDLLDAMWIKLIVYDNTFADMIGNYSKRQNEADEYRELCEENNKLISKKIRKLAEEITKDCTYDWEKAEALQQYFAEDDFTYDIAYHPKDTSPEYFLFESRRGSCSDFASAYVLMARSVGLTVRYAEGYIPQRGLGENVYTISDSDSHAYPEVFIQNFGWTVYEPTMPSNYQMYEDKVSIHERIEDFISKLHIDFRLAGMIVTAAFFGVILVWIWLVVLPFVQERIFLGRVHFSEPAQAVCMLYNRMVRKKVVQNRIKGIQSLTPYEVAGQLELFVDDSVYPAVFVTEQTLYAGYKPSKEEKKQAVLAYKKVKKAARKHKK